MTHINIEGNEIFFITHSDPTIPRPNVHVVDFVGTEGLSKLYQYDLTLASRSQVDLDVAINVQAVFYARANRDLFFIHGIIADIEELREVEGFYFYKATLVPKMWELTQTKRSEVYQNKSIPQIIEQILSDSGFTSPDDYEILLSDRTLPAGADSNDYDANFYRKWEYVCQHQETNFNFISRWMEREGIYYFFEQYQDKTKIIFTDSKGIHIELPENLLTTPSSTLRDALITPLRTEPGPYYLMDYSPPSGLDSTVSSLCVSSMFCKQKKLPNQVVLQDYNYRQSSPVIVGSADIDMPVISPLALPETNLPETAPTVTPGTTAVTNREVHIYGEHIKDIDEANFYAGIRAEEISCRGIVFHGESTIPFLRPGYVYNLRNHFKSILNSDDTNYPATPLYLITEVRHEGGQAPLIFGGTNVPLPPGETKGYYSNTFKTIQDHVQFRPERTTPKPKFYGTINAKVVGDSLGGMYAERNLEGHYRVKLPFDRSENDGQRASRWVRMQQPYAGQSYGADFPMLPGTEVLLTFIDGDPDRPIISGGVYNETDRIASATADASAAAAAAIAAQTSADAIVGDISSDLSDSTETALDRAINARIQQQINSTYILQTAMGNKLSMADAAGHIKVQMHSPGSIWMEAKGEGHEGRYGDYIVGIPDRADIPADLRYLWDKFKDPAGDFKPTKNIRYIHPSTQPELIPQTDWDAPAPPSPLPAGETADTLREKHEWNKLLECGQVQLIKGDTFTTQDGNIYDFGGYWNYNLGNSYAEDHVSQKAELNKTRSRDLLDVGGPHWTTISDNDISSKGNWDPGNVRVQKSFGNEYSYSEAHTISVNTGSSLDISYGGQKHVEKTYSSSDTQTYQSVSENSITDTWKKLSNGNKLYETHSEPGSSTETIYSRDFKDVMLSYHADAQAGASMSSFDFCWANKATAEISFSAVASTALSVGAKAFANLTVGAAVSIDINVSAVATLDIGLAFKASIEGSWAAWAKLEIPSMKTDFKSIGMEMSKEAELKAQKATLRLEKIESDIKKMDMELAVHELSLKKANALSSEAASFKVFM